MTIATSCMLAAVLLPYLFTVTAKLAGGYSPTANRAPREFLASLNGMAARAHYAQLNSFEITPAFLSAVLVAQLINDAEQATVDLLALSFVISRLVYGACYLLGWSTLRSGIWFVGIGIVVALFCV